MMSTSMNKTQKMIVLKSSEGDMFELEETAALESQVLQDMIEAGCADNCIPLPSITSEILAKITEYCKRHSEAADREDLKKFDAGFVEVDESTLFNLIVAANYLNIKSLLDLTCQTVADMIKDKSPEEIRKIYGIKNDFTPEEEERIRKENAWAFEK